MSKLVLLAVVATLALCHGAHIFIDSACDTGYALGEASDNVDCLIGRLNNDTSIECSSGCSVNYDEECTSGYTLIDGDSGDTVCWFGSKGTNINNYYDSSEVACGTGCQVIGDTDCGGGYAFSNGDDSECIDVYTRDDTSEALWWTKTNTVQFVPHEALTEHDVKQLAAAKVSALLQKSSPTEGSQDGIGFNAVAREATIYLNYKEKDDARKAAKAAEKEAAATTTTTTTTTTTKKAEEDVMAAADEDEEAALMQVSSRVHRAAAKTEITKTEHASKAIDEKAAGEKTKKTTKKKRSRTAMTLKKKLQKQLKQ